MAGSALALHAPARATSRERAGRWPALLRAGAAFYLAALILSVFFVGPFGWAVISSFKDASEVVAFPPTFFPKVWRLDNYPRAWAMVPFLRFYINSIIVTGLAADAHGDGGLQELDEGRVVGRQQLGHGGGVVAGRHQGLGLVQERTHLGADRKGLGRNGQTERDGTRGGGAQKDRRQHGMQFTDSHYKDLISHHHKKGKRAGLPHALHPRP